MQDKIDSMDIAVSVPWGTPTAADTFWVASNGKLIDSTIIGTSRIFKFKTLYPIASYLVCVSVAKYERIYRSVNVNGTNVQVVYNLLRGKTTTNRNNAIAAFDKINPVVTAFSTKIGDYPFKLEKHGFYDGLVGASGMEHQTFSGIKTSSLTSIATLTHELMHQWFGDNVTFSNWNDLWLAEGFARYSEALAGELVPTTGLNPFAQRTSMKTSALANTTESAWIPDANAANSTGIWGGGYGGTVYERGAMVVSMLRILAGDNIFFTALTKYQTTLAGKSATTDTLRNYFNRELGRDIAVFFKDFVGGSDKGDAAVGGIGHPTNNINWNAPTTYGQSGKRLIITVASQTTTAGSNVPYFRGPVQLHLKDLSGTKDTTITFFDWGGGNLSYAGNGLSIPIAGNRLSYDLSFVPTTILYDDSARTMSLGTAIQLATLEGYIWLGTTNTDWNDATNWAGNAIPPSGGDVTIATAASNQPVLPMGNTVVGPLTILGTNTVVMGGNTLTLNNAVRSTGTLSGSPTATLIVADQAGILNFNQTSASTRSLLNLTLNPTKTSATVGTGLLEIYGGLNVPTSSTLNVQSANLLMRQ
jgi:Peptidase family M1 domain